MNICCNVPKLFRFSLKQSNISSRGLRTPSISSSSRINWKKLNEYVTTNSVKELKLELLKLASLHGIKSKQVAIITSNIVSKEYSHYTQSIGINILQCFAKEQKSSTILYIGLVELLNISMNRGNIDLCMSLFNKILDIKQVIDLPVVVEKLLQLLCHNGRLNDIEHIMNNSQITINMLIYICEPYILSGKLCQYYSYLIKFYDLDNSYTNEMPNESSVTRLIHSILYGRLRRHNGRTNATDDEYIYMGKIFEWIENYHRNFMSANDLTQAEVIKLESYYAYKQLYKVESEALHLTKLNCSPEEAAALSIFPEFEQVEFPYLVEDRELPGDTATNINHSCTRVDMIHDLTYDLRDDSKLLLFHRDVFPEDYVKEFDLIQKTTLASKQMRQKTEAINALVQMISTVDDEDDADEEDDNDLEAVDMDDDDEEDDNDDEDEDDEDEDFDIDLELSDDEDDELSAEESPSPKNLDSVLTKNYSHVQNDDSTVSSFDLSEMIEADDPSDDFYLKCESLGTVDDSSTIKCHDLTSMNPEFKFLDFGSTIIRPNLSAMSSLSSLGANFFLKLEYIKSNYQEEETSNHSDDDDNGGISCPENINKVQ